MGHARQHDSGDTAIARRPADVEVPPAPSAPVPLPAAPVTSRPAPAAVLLAAPPSDAANALGLQPAMTEGSGFPLRRLHADRPPGQLSPDPAAPPAETGPASPALDGLANALETVEALVTGLYTGVSAELTPEVADALAERLQQSSTLSALFPQVFLAGTVVGIAEDAVEAVRGVIDLVEMVLDIDELIEQATEILEIVVSPEGGELGRVLGEQIGRGWGQQLVDLSTKGVLEFTYELGKIAGPAIVYTVASFLGLPEIAGAAVYARLSKTLLPLLERFPRLATLAARLAKRLPHAHEPHLPHGPRGPHAPHGPHAAPPAGGTPPRALSGHRAEEHPGFDEAFREAPDGSAAPIETRKTRGSHPTKPDSAAAILERIEDRMPALLAEFEKSPASGRLELDRLEKEFAEFMKGKGGRALTAEERQSALKILEPAREESRAYYERFRDFAWRRLNKDPELKRLAAAPDSGAVLGTGKKAADLEVVVTDALGATSTQHRSIDFEHLTRVQDQPFRRHSELAGQKGNLTPMLGDLNRYYQEALRDVGGAHKFGADAVEQFIIQNQLYP